LMADDAGELGGGLLEFFVLEELMDEFPARIDFVVRVGVGIDGVEALGEEHAALNFHQRGGHDEELAGDVEVERLHRAESFEVLFRDGLDRNIVDIDLVFPDEKKEKIKRAFEDLQLDAIIRIGNYGSGDLRGHGTR
jgi:hypothetical protein